MLAELERLKGLAVISELEPNTNVENAVLLDIIGLLNMVRMLGKEIKIGGSVEEKQAREIFAATSLLSVW